MILMEMCIAFLDIYKVNIIDCLSVEAFYYEFTDYLLTKDLVTLEDLISLHR